jgi:hypothetical protein
MNATNFHAFNIPFRYDAADEFQEKSISSTPLIQKSSMRKNNNLFLSVISDVLCPMSRYTIIRVLSQLRIFSMTSHG